MKKNLKLKTIFVLMVVSTCVHTYMLFLVNTASAKQFHDF